MNNKFINIITQKRFVSNFEQLRKIVIESNELNKQVLNKLKVEPSKILIKKTEETLSTDEVKFETEINTEAFDSMLEKVKLTNAIIEKASELLKKSKNNVNNLEIEIIEFKDETLQNLNILNDNLIINKNKHETLNSTELEVIKNLDLKLEKTVFSNLKDYIYSLHDMLNLPGKLVLYTVGGGIVLYGAYKLGSNVLKLFNFRSNNSSVQPQPITIINQQPSLTLSENSNQNNRSNNEGFFKQVGDRVLKLLDIIINKYQYKKYK